jgi:hypothetical protein
MITLSIENPPQYVVLKQEGKAAIFPEMLKLTCRGMTP